MTILEAVRGVDDCNGTDVDSASVKVSMNRFDEIAVEEAGRLKEAGMAIEVIVASAGAT